MKYSQIRLRRSSAASQSPGVSAHTGVVSSTAPTEKGVSFAYLTSAPVSRAHVYAPPVSHVPATAIHKPATDERYRFVTALILTLSYLVLLVNMVFLSMGRADVGLTATSAGDGRWVVTSIVPSGPSYDQDVRPGDVIVGGDQSFLRSLAGKGGTVSFSGAQSVVIQKAGNRAQTVTVSAKDRDGGQPIQRWAFAFLGLIFIGVGGPVFVKARQRTAASAFYVFCVATAVALALAPVAYLLYDWALAAVFIDMVVIAASFAFFFFRFPVQIGATKLRQLSTIAILAAFGVLVILCYLWVLLGHTNDYIWVRQLYYVYLAGCASVGLGSLIKSLIAERSPEIRQQLALLLGGTAFAIGPSVVLGILPGLLLGRVLIPIETTALALGIMPLAFAYAITQHQLLGVRNFVRRSVVYVVMGSSVLLVFSVGAATLSNVVPKDWTDHEWGLIGFGLFVFLLASSFSYLQRLVERLVDKYIYHDAYDYKEALLQFSAQLAVESKLQVLTDELVEHTCRLMNLSCGVLLLVAPSDNEDKLADDLFMTDLALDTSKLDSTMLGIQEAVAQVEQMAATIEAWEPLPEQPDARDIHSPEQNADHICLTPYARYGDCADWFIEGLQAELSKLGVSIDQQSDTAMHFIYLSEDESGADTARYQATADGREDGDISALDSGSLSAPSGSAERGVTRSLDPDTIRSFLGVPLWTRSHFVGVLCLGGKKTGERFTKDDLSLLSTLGSQAALAIHNAQLTEVREQALLDTITALAHAIEAKDGYTSSHCEKMTGRAVAVARALGLPDQEVENVRLGAILHDVGKIGIPDAVLNKPGKLTAEEYEIMKQHAVIGARIVQPVAALQGVVPIVRHHQERYDGSGYPMGIAGQEIPLGARIIGVVDTYGAMTEDRIYRKAPGHERAVNELIRFAGQQFDPDIVEAFINLMNEHPELAETEYAHASALEPGIR